jgi:hypothetical protein
MLALAILPVASAQAASFTMSVDDAILDLGTVSGVRAIDSTNSDPPATLTGDLTGNTVNVPKDGFVFPPKEAEVTGGITATINMEANEDITGTYDAGTGALVLDANLKATVEVLGSNCVISPIVLQLSSSNARPYLGQAFSSGIEGTGVVSASWDALPEVTGGGLCSTVAGLIDGPGGIAMAHGVHDFQTCTTDPDNPLCTGVAAPTVAPNILTSPPASTAADIATFTFEKGAGETSEVTGFQCSLDGAAFQACDSGSMSYTGLAASAHKFQVKATNSGGAGPVAEYDWTVTKNSGGTGKAKFGALKVTPKKKKVKRGKRATITVKVKNVGKATASGVKICVKAPKKLVKVKKCVTKSKLAAGATATARFKVKVAKKAKKGKKATLKFKATGKGLAAKNAKAIIKIG